MCRYLTWICVNVVRKMMNIFKFCINALETFSLVDSGAVGSANKCTVSKGFLWNLASVVIDHKL